MQNNTQDILKTEDLYKDLFDNAHDLIHIAHLDASLIYANNSWTRLLEYSLEEISGRSFYSFINEPDQTKFRQYREEIIGGKISDEQIIISLQTKSGRTVSIEGFVSAKIKDGTPVYTRGIFRDVTAKLEDEAKIRNFNEALQEREFYFQKLLMNAPDPIIVIDEESNIIFWNPKSEAVFGWKSEEVLGCQLSATIVPEQYREAHNRGMKRYLATGVAHVINQTVEITAINKKGEEFFVALTISTTMANNKIAFIAFIRDTTQQKNNLLQLERKTKELIEVNTNLEDFAYAASHDLKEPIRKIQFFADRLRVSLNEKLDETDNKFFERMEVACTRMQLLVDDLLEYSHTTKGTGLFEKIDLNRKVELVMDDIQLLIEEKKADITVAKLPMINGHRRQIQQLFQNLLVNAIKYSKPNNPPKINISCKVISNEQLPPILQSKKQDFYLIEVKDNGIGFEQKYADRIFNVFQRLHESDYYKGTGVGLAIAQKVAENHKGFITAESQLGEGSNFKVYLPVE